MNLNFTKIGMKSVALTNSSAEYKNNFNSAEAFIIVLNGLDYETIENLCVLVAQKLNFGDSHKIYEFIQTGNCNYEFKQIVLDTAYEIIHSNNELGNKIINEKFNAASWIAHSLYEGEVASSLARVIGLDSDTALKLGLLHDIGRKFDHTFMHTIKGYEYLVEKGFPEEAICCLTHSFLSNPTNGVLKGNRCANCDPSIEGFYIDENGNGVFKSDSDKDDITLFLENYQYNLYDVILNISDLMAMSSGIVSPYERVMDVYTRKTPDSKNSPFFKVCFINTLIRILYIITHDDKYLHDYNYNDFESDEQIEKKFAEISSIFMNEYNELIKENSKTI